MYICGTRSLGWRSAFHIIRPSLRNGYDTYPVNKRTANEKNLCMMNATALVSRASSTLNGRYSPVFYGYNEDSNAFLEGIVTGNKTYVYTSEFQSQYMPRWSGKRVRNQSQKNSKLYHQLVKSCLWYSDIVMGCCIWNLGLIIWKRRRL